MIGNRLIWFAALATLMVLSVNSAASAQQLFGLTIEPETEGSEPYDRDLYNHWIDDDGDGVDTRHEVLVLESLVPPTMGGTGRVTDGLWFGPYSGYLSTQPSDFDIDHMVPLKEVHQSGGHAWDADRREAYANDLGHAQALIAVQDNVNQSKGFKDPAEWMPPNRAYWCAYLAGWIAIKQRWEYRSIKPKPTRFQRARVYVTDIGYVTTWMGAIKPFHQTWRVQGHKFRMAGDLRRYRI